jgi:ribosomal-protein-serine acetyltransferase
MRCQLQIGDDVHLRLLGEADATELHRVIEKNRSHLADWMPWAAGQTLDGTIEFIRRGRRQLTENNGFQAVVVSESDFIGTIGFHSVDWANRSTSLGYWLDEGHQGRGVMTAAVRVLAAHALSAWELNRVEICAAVENRRSRAIPERLGFEEDGTLEQRELVNGRYLDCVVYSTNPVLFEPYRGTATGQS